MSEGWIWLERLLRVTVVGAVSLAVLIALLKICILWRTWRQYRIWGYSSLTFRPVVVGFFHPYCNAGGGGERVLWHSICALQKRYSFVRCVVYTGDSRTIKPKDILNKAQDRFGIVFPKEVKFVYLRCRCLVEAGCWPRFTLLGQSIGSIILGMEALVSFAPHVYIDTMGYAFTVPLFRWLGGSRPSSYVHYPTVSRDMLEQVNSQVMTHNNAAWISRSKLFTKIKSLYYKCFASVYGFVGRRNAVVMVNSTWTHGHIAELWHPQKLFIVYPPCDTSAFQHLPIERPKKAARIVSLGQFRPEKDHKLQLRVLAELLRQVPVDLAGRVCLVLVGSCRDDKDYERVDDLKHYAGQLGVLNHVQFRIGISFEELQQELAMASAALHTMWNEHFGIALVECMAAGCVMVAHASGGPALDIVVDWEGQQTGFLAADELAFVSSLLNVLQMSKKERQSTVTAARDSVQAKFSVNVFEASFLRATEQLFG